MNCKCDKCEKEFTEKEYLYGDDLEICNECHDNES